ncbi:Hypothetical predicted protein [Marmota monax]|uniref:Uncharacterized protein n=1 Tax=Marmota monax TaxID=9995 RepID=A0A5E4BTB9_MARMO|nr:hypothetical protein GHT09_008547 [Marmota monax]VTJ72814.1 Hypothetical predicted protein [Marmota monax]
MNNAAPGICKRTRKETRCLSSSMPRQSALIGFLVVTTTAPLSHTPPSFNRWQGARSTDLGRAGRLRELLLVQVYVALQRAAASLPSQIAVAGGSFLSGSLIKKFPGTSHYELPVLEEIPLFH